MTKANAPRRHWRRRVPVRCSVCRRRACAAAWRRCSTRPATAPSSAMRSWSAAACRGTAAGCGGLIVPAPDDATAQAIIDTVRPLGARGAVKCDRLGSSASCRVSRAFAPRLGIGRWPAGARHGPLHPVATYAFCRRQLLRGDAARGGRCRPFSPSSVLVVALFHASLAAIRVPAAMHPVVVERAGHSRRNVSSASLKAVACDVFSPCGAPRNVTSLLCTTARWVRCPEPWMGTIASASP